MLFTWQSAGSRTSLFAAAFRGAVITAFHSEQEKARCSMLHWRYLSLGKSLARWPWKSICLLQEQAADGTILSISFSMPFCFVLNHILLISSYILFSKKKIFLFHPSLCSEKPQIASTVWFLKSIQQLSGFPRPLDVHVISSRMKGRAGRRAWRAAERYPLCPSEPARCALEEVREWLQRSPRARNWAMAFLPRLLSSQHLTGKWSCRKTRKMASLCHKTSIGTIWEETNALGLCTALFFSLCLVTATRVRDLWSQVLSSLLSSNPALDGWSWWHDTW